MDGALTDSGIKCSAVYSFDSLVFICLYEKLIHFVDYWSIDSFCFLSEGESFVLAVLINMSPLGATCTASDFGSGSERLEALLSP